MCILHLQWLESMLLLSHFSRQPTRLPIPGILQARTLEWVAISFSNAWKWKGKVKLLSRVRPSATPWTAAYQAPPSMGFPGRSTGVGCHCLLPVREYKDNFNQKVYWVPHMIGIICWALLCYVSSNIKFIHFSWKSVLKCLLHSHY